MLATTAWLAFAPRVATLDLSRNQLQRVPNFEGHTSLTALRLHHNAIKLVVGLESLCNLTQLDVSHNDIRSPLALRTLSVNSRLATLTVHPNPVTADR